MLKLAQRAVKGGPAQRLTPKKYCRVDNSTANPPPGGHILHALVYLNLTYAPICGKQPTARLRFTRHKNGAPDQTAYTDIVLPMSGSCLITHSWFGAYPDSAPTWWDIKLKGVTTASIGTRYAKLATQ